EERVLAPRHLAVARHGDRDSLAGSLAGRVEDVIGLPRQRRGAAPPDPAELGEQRRSRHGVRGDAECDRLALDGGEATAAAPQDHRSISSSSPTSPTFRAGTPITSARGGTSRVTTAPVATNASSPISIPGRMRTPPPMRAALRIVGPTIA